MTQTYKPDLKHIFLSYRSTLGWCLLFSLPIPLLYLTDYFEMTTSKFEDAYKIMIFIAVVLTPAVTLHLKYYITNSGTILSIDRENDRIEITYRGTYYEYRLSDIKQIRRTLAIGAYNMDDAEYNGRIPLWGDFGHITFEFNDGNAFRFTSIMITPRTFLYDNSFEAIDSYSFYPFYISTP